MLRFRALTLLTLILSVLGLRYGILHSTIPAAGNPTFLGVLLLMTCPFFTITTVTMLTLSFLALTVASDGVFVIKRKNVYGRVFSYLATRESYGRHETSFCRTFWRTNALLFMISVMLGLAAFFVVLLMTIDWSLSLLLTITGTVVLIAAIVAIMHAFQLIGETRTWQKMSNSKAGEVTKTGVTGILILAVVALLGFAAWSIFTNVSGRWLGLVLVGVLAIVVVVWGTISAWRTWIADSNFGIALTGTYETYLCPRLRIE